MTARDDTRRADERRAQLLGPLRSAVLSTDQLCDASRALYGDPDRLALFGMSPREFGTRGVKLFGRTVVECTTDPHAIAIARATGDVARALGVDGFTVVDLFTGSGNLLHHLAVETGAARAIGFERDPNIAALTRANLAAVASPAALYARSFEDGLRAGMVPADRPCVVCVHPPWGVGFSFRDGLDMRRTEPPTPAIVRAVCAALPDVRPLLF